MSNQVSITDLLAAIGSDNIKFQYLATCMEGIKSAKGRNLITFSTDALTPTDAVQDTGPRGLIVWVDKELMRKRLDELKAGNGLTMDQMIQQRDEAMAEAHTWEKRACNEAAKARDLELLVGKLANTVPTREVLAATGTDDALVSYFTDLHQQLADMLAALSGASEKMKAAHKSMFEQCLSNPVSNAWGKEINVSAINDLQLEASRVDAVIAKAKGGAA